MAAETPSPLYIAGSRQATIVTVIIGLFVGLAGWALSIVLRLWIITPIFCQSAESYGICSNGGTVAWTVAMIIVSIIGLLGLVRFGVFRPLLVVLATLVALWSASAWLGPLPWWQSLLWHGALFALAYGLFGWIAKLRAFLPALIIIVVLVIAARVVVVNS